MKKNNKIVMIQQFLIIFALLRVINLAKTKMGKQKKIVVTQIFK